MSTLILVKHSIPEIVENVPAREWKLSVEGRFRCKRLAERLAKYQPSQIVSSVEPKAKETAELSAKELGLPTSTFEGLHEHERSKVAYLSKGNFEEAVREFFAHPDDLVFGSETAEQAYQRFQTATDSILKKYSDQTVVVVAHGTVISLYVSRLTGVSDLMMWKELGLPSFVVLDVESKVLLVQENIE
ncbi:MAG: histidine phosphatase family protein [Anaerolineales bacterium]